MEDEDDDEDDDDDSHSLPLFSKMDAQRKKVSVFQNNGPVVWPRKMKKSKSTECQDNAFRWWMWQSVKMTTTASLSLLIVVLALSLRSGIGTKVRSTPIKDMVSTKLGTMNGTNIMRSAPNANSTTTSSNNSLTKRSCCCCPCCCCCKPCCCCGCGCGCGCCCNKCCCCPCCEGCGWKWSPCCCKPCCCGCTGYGRRRMMRLRRRRNAIVPTMPEVPVPAASSSQSHGGTRVPGNSSPAATQASPSHCECRRQPTATATMGCESAGTTNHNLPAADAMHGTKTKF
ncbi:hypothetical protein niasHT_008168 [Heterodera trifolii]|uniref:Uncharacterized protein n=1 Tax=Heterodera trifolii TaxID=157864 RepID=A0ABD2LU94_9BILA